MASPATSTAIALCGLTAFLQTMVEAHGGANIFQRVGEFPNAADPEYPWTICG
jgi:hypothetical protein